MSRARSLLAAAALMAVPLAYADEEFARPAPEPMPPRPDRDESVRGWIEKPKPRDWKLSTETPGTFGQRTYKRRAKSKAATKARTAQRMRAKGKR